MQNRLNITLAAAFLLMVSVLLASAIFRGGYGIASTALVLLSMLPFYLRFEKRKPKARDIVPVAVMSAIAVVGRLAFAFVPQFKPVIAIIIITAVAFGAEAGFLCGTASMLVSNFFFGQGPWTPWQMFACGMIGALAGVLSSKGILRGRLGLAVFGALTGFVYGCVVDIWTVVGFSSEISLASVAAVYIAGAGFNTTLAAATAFFLHVLAPPMTKKLDRIKAKYGIL